MVLAVLQEILDKSYPCHGSELSYIQMYFMIVLIKAIAEFLCLQTGHHMLNHTVSIHIMRKPVLYHFPTTKVQISTFFVHCLDSIRPVLDKSKISRPWLVPVVEQASFSLTWSQILKTFSHDVVHMYVAVVQQLRNKWVQILALL